MKILTVTYSLHKGGVARTSVTQAISYRRLGVDSRVLVTTETGPREEDLNVNAIPYWLGLGESVLQQILQWNPDVLHIHSHGFGDQEMERLYTMFPGRIVVEKNVFSRPVAWTARMDYSYQLSIWCAWRFCNAAPELAGKAVIVPNGADSSAFVRASESNILAFKNEHGIPNDALVIGRIGQHYETKWSPVLIQAFDWLAKKRKNLYLLVVNPSKPVRKQAADSRFTSRIVIIDKIIGDKTLCEAYSSMDVFALAADQGESFGNVLAESLLCEVPAVVLSTPWQDNSQCEVVGHNRGGLVALTPKGFRKAIETLLQDEPRRRALGRTGRKQVIEKYDCLKAAQTSLDAIQGNLPPLDRSTLEQEIVEIYKDAFEKASFWTLLFMKKRLLRLTRYTTHYRPAWKLPIELFKLGVRKLVK